MGQLMSDATSSLLGRILTPQPQPRSDDGCREVPQDSLRMPQTLAAHLHAERDDNSIAHTPMCGGGSSGSVQMRVDVSSDDMHMPSSLDPAVRGAASQQPHSSCQRETAWQSASTLGLKLEGLRVSDMLAGGPAHLTGVLEVGDTLLEVDGVALTAVEQAVEALRGSDVAGEVCVSVDVPCLPCLCYEQRCIPRRACMPHTVSACPSPLPSAIGLVASHSYLPPPARLPCVLAAFGCVPL